MYSEDNSSIQRGYFYTGPAETIRNVFMAIRQEHLATCPDAVPDQDQDEDNEGCTHEMPEPRWVWEICSDCHGDGGRALGGAVVSGESLYDAEFMADYMRGRYDTTCEECKGSGKVSVPSCDDLSDEVKKRINKALREDSEANSESLMERRAGA